MSAHPRQPAEHTKAAEEAARAKDPHGVKPASDAGRHEAAGLPDDDRHKGETATGS